MREPVDAVALQVERLRANHNALGPTTGTSATRRRRFNALAAKLRTSRDPAEHPMACLMGSFCPGLFAAGDDLDFPLDDLALERAGPYLSVRREITRRSAAAASPLAALLVAHIPLVCSLLAPCERGASTPEHDQVISRRTLIR